MTKIAIVPNAAGTGTFTIEAPNSNSNRTLVLPDVAGSVVVNETNRIRADFSAALADRTMLQSSVTNGNTLVRAIPNGTGTLATFQVGSSNDPANQSVLGIQCVSGETASINSFANGTGTVLPLVFSVGASERARIDTSGFFMVGRSSPQNNNSHVSFEVTDAGTNNFWVHQNSTTTGVGTGVIVATTRINTNLDTSGFFYDAASDWPNSFSRKFAVRKDGVIFAVNTTVQSLSDQRIKQNITDASDGLDVVMGLRPRRFDFIEGQGNGNTNQLGFIAQEAEVVFPEMVGVMHDMKLDGEDEPLKTVGPAALIPVLVKAIQEQQAIIEALKADVAELKGASA